tara:strand:- start:9339 stop:10889 length:1551 start_codon:yes stop_codon:yes gene_type:complete
MSQPATISPQALLIGACPSAECLQAYLDDSDEAAIAFFDRRVLESGSIEYCRADPVLSKGKREIIRTAAQCVQFLINGDVWALERALRFVDVVVVSLSAAKSSNGVEHCLDANALKAWTDSCEQLQALANSGDDLRSEWVTLRRAIDLANETRELKLPILAISLDGSPEAADEERLDQNIRDAFAQIEQSTGSSSDENLFVISDRPGSKFLKDFADKCQDRDEQLAKRRSIRAIHQYVGCIAFNACQSDDLLDDRVVDNWYLRRYSDATRLTSGDYWEGNSQVHPLQRSVYGLLPAFWQQLDLDGRPASNRQLNSRLPDERPEFWSDSVTLDAESEKIASKGTQSSFGAQVFYELVSSIVELIQLGQRVRGRLAVPIVPDLTNASDGGPDLADSIVQIEWEPVTALLLAMNESIWDLLRSPNPIQVKPPAITLTEVDSALVAKLEYFPPQRRLFERPTGAELSGTPKSKPIDWTKIRDVMSLQSELYRIMSVKLRDDGKRSIKVRFRKSSRAENSA